MFTTNSNTGPLPEYANIQTARGIKVLYQVPRNLFHRAVVYLFNTQVNCVFFASRPSSGQCIYSQRIIIIVIIRS